MINVTQSSMPGFEEYCAEIRDLWDSHWLTNMGAKHQRLQKELEDFLKIPHVTLFANGHLALENALCAMKLPKGGEVITTPFTFASTTHAIIRSGLVPVFCDIRTDDYTMDAAKIEALVTEKTCAILPVHVYGNVCDAEAIREVADRHGLKVIYDAAHAFGVTVNGMSVASLGDVSMFSFHATKVFNTVEGGAVCFRDDALVPLLDEMKNFGLHGAEECNYAGGNAKMSELHAAMGICNLRHLSEEIEKRHRVAARYREHLEGVPGIRLCQPKPGVSSNDAYFPVVFENFKYTRDELFERLRQNGITPRKYFYPLTSSFQCCRKFPAAGADRTPVAQHVAQCVLALPIYADLSLKDVDRICDWILA